MTGREENSKKRPGSFFQDQDRVLFAPSSIPLSQSQGTTQPQPQKQVLTADDIINQVWTIPSPKPVYDANRPEEIKRLMRNNALTNMFRTLGETFSLAKGGNVQRREPDQTNNQLLGAYWKSLDDYYNKMNDWQGQNYMNEIRKGLARVSQKNAEDQMDFNRAKLGYDVRKDARDFGLKEKQIESTNELKKSQQEATKAYQEGTLNLRAGQLANDRARSEETMRHNQAIEGIQSKRAEGTSRTPILYDDRGNEVIRLRPSEEQKLIGIILNDPAAQKEMETLKPSLGEPLSAETKKYLIAKYWNKFPGAVQYVNQLTGAEQTIPQSAPQPTSQDTAKPKINYNALVF